MIRTAMMIVVLTAFAMLNATWEFDANAGFTYDENVFNLSDDDIDRFEDGESYFDWMEAADDFVIDASLRARYRTTWGDWDISPFVKGSHEQFTSNTDKSHSSVLAGVNLDWKKLALNFYYGNYPDNWVRNYKYTLPSGSTSSDPVEFSYDKNMFKLDANYRLFRKDWVYLYTRFEQYFHNDHFTEYDADATIIGVGWRHSFKTFYFSVKYNFRQYNCDGAPDVAINNPDAFSDASYDADIIEIGFRNKKVEFARHRYIRPFITFEFESRGYQNDNPQDTFHAGREDKIYNVTFGADFNLWPNIDFNAEYNHKYRNTDSSINSDISKTKDYIANEFSLGVQYSFSL